MKSLIHICLYCLVFFLPCSAQERSWLGTFFSGTPDSPCALSWEKDGLLFGSVLALRAVVPKLPQNLRDLSGYTEAELNKAYRRQDVNPIDRMFIGPYKSFYEHSSRYSNGLLWCLPFGFLIPSRSRADILKVGVMFVQIQLMYPLVTGFINPRVARMRPYGYSEEETLAWRKADWSQMSFVSGHTNFGFAFGVFTACVYSDYFPDSKWKPAVWTAALGLASATGISRVLARRHFPTDVIPAALTGSFIGWFVPWIHRKNDSRVRLEPSLSPLGGSGMAAVVNFR